MTRKHFNKLAKAIASISDAEDRQMLANMLGNICEEVNSRFDWERWYAACQVKEET